MDIWTRRYEKAEPSTYRVRVTHFTNRCVQNSGAVSDYDLDFQTNQTSSRSYVPGSDQSLLEEVWQALENMAPRLQEKLSEAEFLARFRILVQSPFFARSLYLGYLAAKE